MRSSYKESIASNAFVWNPSAEEGIKKVLYIVDSRSMDFEDANEEDSLATNVESIRVEEVLNYFRDMKTVIEEPSKVRRYLYSHPEIADLSRFVAEKVSRYFDYSAQLCLTVNGDHNPDSEYLALFLRVPNYDDTVMDRIGNIQKSYFDLLSTMTGWFLFTTDFCPPR